jgi:tetratricopeptide (TPR) repeat protein
VTSVDLGIDAYFAPRKEYLIMRKTPRIQILQMILTRRWIMKLYSMMLVVMLMALLSACIAPMPPAPGAETTSDQAMHEAGEHETMAQVGEVDFAVSCTPEAQAAYNHSMALLHSFEYPAAIESFNTVAELDPTCAMAHWGVAMSLVEPLWGEPTSQMLADGWAAVEKAMAAGAKTPREQAYIDAIAAFYKDSSTVDHRTRALAYKQAMAQLVQDYPEDTEAQIFYALALLATAQPTDKSYANQRHAVDILAQIFADQPDHPGVAHYMIHSNDYPALAEHGLEAAQRYAGIAPDAPHALHMPSHIFTRLGYWQESVETNIASANAAKAALPESDRQTIGSGSALHAMDYMMYAYLQMAQDGAAKALLDEIHALEKIAVEDFGAAYALATMPARYVLERGQWAEAATLALHPQTFGWATFPQAEASLVFARGLGAARAGDVDAARQELERLQSLHETLVTGGPEYWAGQVEIQVREVDAWIALAEERNEEALALMREAVELEAATEKHPVTPGPIAPAHELLGDMLLKLEQPAEALVEFEASLVTEPNRFRSLYGAARAAELAGEMETARAHYEALIALSANADSERAEVTEAETFLAQ